MDSEDPTVIVFDVAEGTTSVGTITASDPDSQDTTFTFSLPSTFSGFPLADASLFTITNAGALSFNTAPVYVQGGDNSRNFVVTVTSSDGTSAREMSTTKSVEVKVTDVPPPDAPAAPTVSQTSGSNTSLDVSWTAPADNGNAIDDYDIQYRVKEPQGEWQGQGQGSATTATIAGLQPNTTYQVQVRAHNVGGESDWSPSGEGTTAAGPPDAPAAPTVTPNTGSATSLDVSWTAPADNGAAISDYDVQYRAGTSGSFTTWSFTGNGTSTTITGLTTGTSYEVQVAATNTAGTSAWSQSGTGTPSDNSPPTFDDLNPTGGCELTRYNTNNRTWSCQWAETRPPGYSDYIDHLVRDVQATDPDEGDEVTYSLSGADADRFAILSPTGLAQSLSFNALPDYENPTGRGQGPHLRGDGDRHGRHRNPRADRPDDHPGDRAGQR